MRKSKKKILITTLCAFVLSASLSVPLSPVLGDSNSRSAVSAEAAGRKNGLKKENGHYCYYANGRKCKKGWKTINGKRYYFKKDGNAAVLSCKINGTYYVFNQKGQLVRPSSKKIVKIGNKKYYVNPKGMAVKGWSKNKKNYFYNTGQMVTGIEVFGEQFYCFSSTGVYNKTKTANLRKVAKYRKKLAPVQKIIGKPRKSTYGRSCFGDGKDGILTYKNFTVYTFKPTNGDEIFMGAE